MRTPEDCSRFEVCSAPLCPLDHHLKKQLWFLEEPVCRKYRVRWVKKQKSLQKSRPAKWTGKAMTILDLVSISRPPKRQPMTDAERKAVHDRLQNGLLRQKKPFLTREIEAMGGESDVR